MKYIAFFLFLYSLVTLAYAGPQDKWVYVGSTTQFDGIALLLGIGAFAWVYIIYRDFKSARHGK